MRASTPGVPKALTQCPKGTYPEGRQGKCAVLAGRESVPTAASVRLHCKPLQSRYLDSWMPFTLQKSHTKS